eukprot:COSAG01_NODE_11874_length_1843_cov_4.344037_1_plen_603_part_10
MESTSACVISNDTSCTSVGMFFLCGGGCVPRPPLGDYTCTCRAGWRGEVCTVDVDECQSSPCVGGGFCFDSKRRTTSSAAALHSTACTSIGEDTNCNMLGVQMRACALSCVPLVQVSDIGAYGCECVAGFTGRNCQDDIDECASNPCGASGACADSSMCQPPISPCSAVGFQQCAGGTCVPTIASNAYSCTCIDGMQGENCEVDTDECASSPCQNGGLCMESSANVSVSVSTYTCLCTAGWAGSNCIVDLDECLSQPCLHGGTCLESSSARYVAIGSYICNCTTGRFGSNCFYTAMTARLAARLADNNECLSSPCDNGATCEDSFAVPAPDQFYSCAGTRCILSTPADLPLGNYRCTCQSGYTGTNCATKCPFGTVGLACEIDIDECASGPCQNNGTCIESNSANACSLSGGNPCSSLSMQYCGGTCAPRVMMGRYTCVCITGFQGPDCEVDTDECASSPCQNGGLCMESTSACVISNDTSCTSVGMFFPCGGGCVPRPPLGDYTCICRAGWRGEVCTVDVDECQSSPCVGGGFCFDSKHRTTSSAAALHSTACTSIGEDTNCNMLGVQMQACALSCVPLVQVSDIGAYGCECVAGFTGRNCQ